MKNKIYHLFFTDICGKLNEKIVLAKNQKQLFQNKVHFDGSSVNGFSTTNDSDLCLLPEKNGLYKNGIVFCNVENPLDTRQALKQATKNAKLLGFDVKIGAEIEFYLFKKQSGNSKTIIRDNKNYMSVSSVRMQKFIRLLINKLSVHGIKVEAIHHEASNNQYEINFHFGNPIETADKVMLIKQELKWLAEKQKCYVSFMPKPFSDSAGSGMHINISIFKNGINLFSESNNNYLEWFANGIMNHIKGITAVTCPNINSYKRLSSKFECPNRIFMSKRDRTALIRIPQADEKSRRIEVRSPDISCNPYLSFAMFIEAGINGMLAREKCITINSNLPQTLSEAVLELKTDTFLSSKFTEITNKYIQIKQSEINKFNNFITDFEKLNFY